MFPGSSSLVSARLITHMQFEQRFEDERALLVRGVPATESVRVPEHAKKHLFLSLSLVHLLRPLSFLRGAAVTVEVELKLQRRSN